MTATPAMSVPNNNFTTKDGTTINAKPVIISAMAATVSSRFFISKS
jgi:hypothetical protein